jgi:zinc protease
MIRLLFRFIKVSISAHDSPAHILYNINMKTNINNKRILSWVIGSLFLTALVLTCATTSRVDYAGLGRAEDRIPLTSKALTGKLPNGLTYYILENSRPENRAHLALVVNAGSVLERDDERGLAHFVEHLAFNDTARFPQLELIEYLRSLGMRFGADANAYTSYDETVYHFDVPVENTNGVKRIPDRALAILDDWTYAVSFLPADVQSESLVVLEEHRARLGAGDRVRKIMLPILFAGSPYAQREPIGLTNIIENATSEQLRGFYDRWYTSDNMALVFVGDFDGKALEAELVRHFNMPEAQQPVNRPVHELPGPRNGNFQIEIITDPELTTVEFDIYYKLKQSSPRGTLASYRESIVDYLIDTMLTMRFEEASYNPESSSTGSWGGIWRWSTNARFYSMGTEAKTGSAEAALRELLLEKEEMRRYGFTESELERAKLRLLSYMERQLSEADRRDSRSYINSFTAHFLHGEDMADIEWEMNAVSSMLPGIGAKEIARAAANYFSANDCVVFLIAPQAEAANLPSKERIRAIFNETSRARITARQNDSISDQLLDRQPAAGTIASEVTDSETGAIILTLGNGATVILKQTENRNNEVAFIAMAKGGLANAPQDAVVSVSLAPNMVEVSGRGPYSNAELENKLAGKQVSGSFWISQNMRGFQGGSTTKDLKTHFELLYMFFTMPRFDERAIVALLDQYRTYLAHQDENPQYVFSRELNRILYNNHPFYTTMELADMDRVSIDKAYEFLLMCLNPADYTFVFTGNFDIGEMRQLLSIYLASIPNSPSMNTWVTTQIAPPVRTERAVYKGQDERSIVYLSWIIPASAGFDEARNQVAAVLTEYLDIMLTNEIREKLGGVYSISASAGVTMLPDPFSALEVFFYCNPSRVNELVAAVNERLRDVMNRPLNQDTFNQSKEALLMAYENSMQSNQYIAQSFANSVLYNTPLGRLNARAGVIRAVTMNDVQALCRQMLSGSPVQLVLYPEGWR